LNKKEQPSTPHNTTQFIVNTVYYPTDPYIYDFDSSKFGNDLKNHSMLGSMMDLMKDKMPIEVANNDNRDMTNDNPNDNNPNSRMVTEQTGSECNRLIPLNKKDHLNDLNDLLLQSKTTQSGSELQSIIDKLYHVIKQKDDLIHTLSLTRKNSI